MLKKVKLSTKIIALFLIIITAFSVILTEVYFKYSKLMYDSKNIKTKEVVETAWGVLDYYAKQAKSNKMDVEEAKSKAKEALKNLRYNTEEYFWINDTEPVMIMHPIKSEMNNTNVSDYKDPNGKRIFVEAVDVAKKNGSGYVDYSWPKPGESKPVPKTSYVKMFPEWNWVVGSGIYIDDVQKEMRNVTIIFTALIVVLLAGVLPSIYFFVRKMITTPIEKIVIAAGKIAEGNMNVDLDIDSEDEIGDLAISFSTMTDNVRSLSSQMSSLTKAAIEGKLDNRVDAEKFKGAYKEIIVGANKTLDAATEPIKEATKVLAEMSNGNLDVMVNGDYKGEHALIKNSLNDTIHSFNDVLIQINSSAEQVSMGSKHIASSGQSLAQGSSEQASSIQEITSSMTEVATQTKDNAVNAGKANELAVVAKENAIIGNQQMKEMLKAMQEINDSSDNISKIIKVIDEIAFQTNILALNAAVEAARAGHHGKGFAVVAEEVRNLAARSANAAKETTAMIESSIKKVGAGTKMANETDQALEKIVDSVTRASELVGSIAAASNEQATAISQINMAIEQTALVVQTTSSTAEESSVASKELSMQANLLKSVVSRFKLKKVKSLSLDNLNNIEPEILKALEQIIEKKNSSTYIDESDDSHMEENTFKVDRNLINIDSTDFGKY